VQKIHAPNSAYTTHRNVQAHTEHQSLHQLISNDAIRNVANYTLTHDIGFHGRVLKQRLAGVYFARDGGRNVAWVVVATSPRTNFECHVCLPILSVLIYQEEEPNKWRLKSYGYKTGQGTSGWDMMPRENEMALVHISPDHVALAILSVYATMGWGMTYYEIVSVEGNQGRRLFFTTMSQSSGASNTPTSADWSSTLTLRPTTDSPWYDIHLHRKGIHKGRPIDYTVIYRYQHGKYQAMGEDKVTEEP